MKDLLEKYLNNQCTAEEVHRLLDLFGQPENETVLRQAIADYLQQTEARDNTGSADSQKAISAVFSRLQPAVMDTVPQKAGVLPFYKTTIFRLPAAAVLLLLAGAGFFLFTGKSLSPTPVARQAPHVPATDVAPGGNKAVLTLADGSRVILDSATNGALAIQGNTNIIKLSDGQLSYHAANSQQPGNSPIAYNTITTPRGGQYQVVLSDGSRVWLNAASSLRFPSAFAGPYRTVEISGEAYFEVAKNKASPFRVKSGNLLVEVLGTHFNVHAYSGESSVETTLLEGAVTVQKNGAARRLHPGEQAVSSTGSSPIAVRPADVEKVVAWKENLFHFDGDDLEVVMDQLSRWYNVSFRLEGRRPSAHFTGIISRQLPLSKVLYMLEASGVHFQINGREISVSVK